MHILGVLGDPKNASKIPPCRGDSLLERVRVLERSRDGVREGPGEKRRSDDARAPGVGAIGATRCRAKALERTGSALDHGGVAGFIRAAAAAADPGTRAGTFHKGGNWDVFASMAGGWGLTRLAHEAGREDGGRGGGS